MAKLHSYYVLCPLIDRNSFLGVSEDREKENVVVSLGRNVINKYRLSDQKQIGGWTSKDHLTSAVIYDKEQDAYVAIFNRNSIKMWQKDSDNLDKVKKYKFSINILKLIPRKNESTLLLFENGNCALLPYALDNRKTYENVQVIKDTEIIVDSTCYSTQKTNHVCYIVKNNKNNYEIITCPIREELGDMEKSKLNKIKVTRKEDAVVVGKLISIQENPSVYILWSDAKMTMYDLIKKSWKTIGTVPWISTANGVSIAWMGKNHLILFGSSCDQDGAIIVAYNVILGVGSCRYPMKLYSENAQLHCFQNHIVLEASNHIGMLPFVLESNRNLSSLLGSHDIVEENNTEISDWGTPVEPKFQVSNDIQGLLKLGLSERNMCAQIILPMLENNDVLLVSKSIKEYKDVPELVLVALLNYTLKSINSNNVDVTNDDEFRQFCNYVDKPMKELTTQKGSFELLNYILQLDFSDAMLIPYLRNTLNLDDALFMLRYISYLLCESDKLIDNTYESKLYDWCTLLMDAFYQQYLLTKDEKVGYVLEFMQKLVVDLVDQLLVVNDTLPLLQKRISGDKPDDSEETLSYTIELLEI